jgi:phosphohistidine phosphatase
MTLTLILTRHAKSDWGTPALADYDRPLNDRGRRAAAEIGRWLADGEHRPEEVILSGALRTVETWERMAPAFDPAPAVRVDRRLYDAAPERMLQVLHGAGHAATMIIGHNPGIGEFAARLATAAPDHPRFDDYPTGATAIIRFHRDAWRDVGWGEGEVTDFVVPRDLTA